MPWTISSVLVSFLLGGFTIVSAQLPPEVEVDRYLLRAERLIAAKDHKGVRDIMFKIVELQREHDLELPAGFYFKYAQAALSTGSIEAAIDSVHKYLEAAGRDGEFYTEALELLDQAERIKALFDNYPEQVDRLVAAKDYRAAIDLIDEIIALREEPALALPEGINSKRAQVVRLTQTCAGAAGRRQVLDGVAQPVRMLRLECQSPAEQGRKLEWCVLRGHSPRNGNTQVGLA